MWGITFRLTGGLGFVIMEVVGTTIISTITKRVCWNFNNYMTKKDYIKIAKVLNEVEKQNITLNQKITFNCIVKKLGNVFFQDNERFDNERFENAIYEK